LTKHVTDHRELHKSGAYGKIQAAQDESTYQQIGPQGIIHLGDNGIQSVKV
jgi:hypothetical protein